MLLRVPAAVVMVMSTFRRTTGFLVCWLQAIMLFASTLFSIGPVPVTMVPEAAASFFFLPMVRKGACGLLVGGAKVWWRGSMSAAAAYLIVGFFFFFFWTPPFQSPKNKVRFLWPSSYIQQVSLGEELGRIWVEADTGSALVSLPSPSCLVCARWWAHATGKPPCSTMLLHKL